MRKLMISTIMVLPLLILAILLVSGAIMSLSVHIYVEAIELVKDNTIYLVLEETPPPPVYNLGKEVTILPLKASNRGLIYKSGDEKVATVDENGIITAIYYGETYITVTSEENVTATASRKVVVTDDKVHALEIKSGYQANMYEETSQTLAVAIYPKEAQNQSVTWSSSDESVLRVSDKGTISAVGMGVASVIVKSDENPDISTSVEITCYPKIRDIDFNSTPVLTSKDKEVFPKLKISPSDFGMSVVYTSDNLDIATINNLGEISFHRAGHVKITAKVTDFGNNSIEVSKEYSSTYGYYTGPLFETKNYTVDYDQYKNGEDLPVEIASAPEGAYQLIQRVSYTTDGILNFNDETKKFSFKSQMPKGVKNIDVTVYATVYDAKNNELNESYVDSFRLNVIRNATEISTSYNGSETSNIQTSQNTLTFSTNGRPAPTTINVKIGPENHTNTIKYTLEKTDIAEIRGESIVFNKSGSVKLNISLYKEDKTLNITKQIEINYTEVEKGDKPLNFSEDISGETTELKTILNMTSEHDKDTGVIYFTTPEEAESVEYKVIEGEEVVELKQNESGNQTINALRGGEAKVQIIVHYKPKTGTIALSTANELTKVYTITIYVDRPVIEEYFTIKLNDEQVESYTTSKGTINYNLMLRDENGCMEGKELFAGYNDIEKKIENYQDYSEIINFADKDDIDLSFEVRYKEDIKEKYSLENGLGLCIVKRKVSSTHGNLNASPTIKLNGSALKSDSENKISFPNINEEIKLSFENDFSPKDFEIATHLPKLEATQFVDVDIAENGDITLRSKLGCKGEIMRLYIGGITFTLNIDVISKADKISVSYNGKELNETDNYTTLLNELAFSVVASRSDLIDIDDKTIEYSFDDSEWTLGKVEDYKIKITILDDAHKIYFRSHDQGAKTSINLSREVMDDLKISLNYQTSDGEQTLDTLDSIKDVKEISYSLPLNVQGSVSIKIDLSDRPLMLGGVGSNDEFKSKFEIDVNTTGWTASYDSTKYEITIKFNGDTKFSKNVTFKYKEISLKINLSLVNIQQIEFIGFDSNNDDHVHPGYQQVKVFAKNSYYDGATVNYFKMPFEALSNVAKSTPALLDDITWNLSSYKGNDGTLTTTQKGRKVVYNGVEYKIDADNKLKTLQNATPSNLNDIIWIDIYSEADKGLARIYFGNFVGLRETDVQNNYFGNFDDKPQWTRPNEVVNDKSDRAFDISETNSFTFLKVEAGDGIKNGINCHYNFNVLDDKTFINVFDEKGYSGSDRKNLVLHANIGEIGEDSEDYAAMKVNGNVAKTTIYGNGYKLNLKAYNSTLNAKNDGVSITFNSLYNLKMFGDDANEKLDNKIQRVYFLTKYVYYCDMKYYFKLDPASTNLYVKNTVFYGVPKTAIQLWGNSNLYVENVIAAACGAGISIENNISAPNKNVYFKGFFDVLDYNNQEGLDKLLNGMASMLIGAVIKEAKNYVEIFGAHTSNVKEAYVNVVVYAQADMSNRIFSWKDGEYVNESGIVNLEDGNRLKNVHLAFNTYYAWTYDTLNTTDGLDITLETQQGLFGPDTDIKSCSLDRADMTKLFTKDRDIRLLCEYLTKDKTNTDHIEWHMQKVYRDLSKFKERNHDHIDHLKNSLNRDDITWPDGTNPVDVIKLMSQTNQIKNLTSVAILPDKKYAA